MKTVGATTTLTNAALGMHWICLAPLLPDSRKILSAPQLKSKAKEPL